MDTTDLLSGRRDRYAPLLRQKRTYVAATFSSHRLSAAPPQR
jgi:hypothetical protein